MRSLVTNIDHMWRFAVLAALAIICPWLTYSTLFTGKPSVALSVLGLVVSAVIIFTWRAPPNIEKLLVNIDLRMQRLNVAAIPLALLLSGWLLAGPWLMGIPISDDVYAVMMQAETFAQGKLYVSAPPVPDAFKHARFVITGDIWISQYLPGWALILAPFAWLKIPLWVVPPFFAVGSVIIFWKIARLRLDREFSILATILLCTSMFFVFNANTLYTHSPATFFGLASVYAALKWRATDSIKWALITGAMIGGMGIIRPFNAAVFIVPIAASIIFPMLRKKFSMARLFSIGAFGFTGFLFVIGLVIYQTMVTGSPFITIPEWMGWSEPIAAASPSSFMFSIKRLVYLSITTSPVLVAGSAVMLFALWRAHQLDFPDAIFPATIVAFLFYGADGGTPYSYGPRYLFEAFPFLILSIVAGLSVIGLDNRFARASIVSALVLQISGLMSWLVFERAAIYSIAEPYRLVRSLNVENALVVLDSPSGKYRTLYPRDLTRNGLDLNKRSVVYADNLLDCGESLRRAFPTRSLWRYQTGTLRKISPSAVKGSKECF